MVMKEICSVLHSWTHDTATIQFNDQFRIIIDLDTGGNNNMLYSLK